MDVELVQKEALEKNVVSVPNPELASHLVLEKILELEKESELEMKQVLD